MLALGQGHGTLDKRPLLQHLVLVLAVGAVRGVWALLGCVHLKGGGEGVEVDRLLLDVQEEQARDEGAGAGLGVVVEDNWRRLDLPLDGQVGVAVGLATGAAKVQAAKGQAVVVVGLAALGRGAALHLAGV